MVWWLEWECNPNISLLPSWCDYLRNIQRCSLFGRCASLGADFEVSKCPRYYVSSLGLAFVDEDLTSQQLAAVQLCLLAVIPASFRVLYIAAGHSAMPACLL